MNAVGIDVSKGRSTVAILRPMGEVVMTPEDVGHSGPELKELAHRILSLGGDTRVVMEATGRYHEPIAAQLHEHGKSFGKSPFIVRSICRFECTQRFALIYFLEPCQRGLKSYCLFYLLNIRLMEYIIYPLFQIQHLLQ